MKAKLIKLNDQFYVVDESEIKKDDYRMMIDKESSFYGQFEKHLGSHECNRQWSKITHSTLPLEFDYDRGVKEKFFNKIRPISLKYIEKLVYGYSVEKMAEKSFENMEYNSCVTVYEEDQFKLGYKLGFNACKELTKDKLFTIEDIMNVMSEILSTHSEFSTEEDNHANMENIIQSLLPKTEWDIDIDEQGKITLV